MYVNSYMAPNPTLIFEEVSVWTFVFEPRCGSLSTREKINGNMEDILAI